LRSGEKVLVRFLIDGRLRAVIYSADLIGVGLHLLLIHLLVLSYFGLVHACLGVQSVFEQVPFLVELRVYICCFYQKFLGKRLFGLVISARVELPSPSQEPSSLVSTLRGSADNSILSSA